LIREKKTTTVTTDNSAHCYVTVLVPVLPASALVDSATVSNTLLASVPAPVVPVTVSLSITK